MPFPLLWPFSSLIFGGGEDGSGDEEACALRLRLKEDVGVVLVEEEEGGGRFEVVVVLVFDMLLTVIESDCLIEMVRDR